MVFRLSIPRVFSVALSFLRYRVNFFSAISALMPCLTVLMPQVLTDCYSFIPFRWNVNFFSAIPTFFSCVLLCVFMSLPGGVYSFLGMHFYFSQWYQHFMLCHTTLMPSLTLRRLSHTVRATFNLNSTVSRLSSRDDVNDAILLLCRKGFFPSLVQGIYFSCHNSVQKKEKIL